MMTLVNLGGALELRMAFGDDWTFPAKDRFIVASNLSANRLYIFSSRKAKKEDIKDNATIRKAEKLWKKWSHFEMDGALKTSVTSKKLFKIGRASAVCYRSDKWSAKSAAYIHTFESPPNVYADSAVWPTVFVIRGRLKVKAEGITG
jgi:hypothetical protein